MRLVDLWLRLRALVLPGRTERDLQDELNFHLTMEARKNRASGSSEHDAWQAARRRFGSEALAADACRDARGLALVETAWQDIRYAARTLRRMPAFALTVIGTIALGLGLNTAVFTIFNAYVLTPFSVRDPYSLFEYSWTTRGSRVHRFSWPEFERLRDAGVAGGSVFSEVFAERPQLVTRIDGHMAYTLLVTGNYFRMLGVEAALGRTLEPADSSAPGREAVAVLSYAFWQRQFGGDSAIVGRRILIQGYPCEIVGIARPGFDGLSQTPTHDVWLPITMAPLLEDLPNLFGPTTPNRLAIVGRLKPGVTGRAAESALLVWARHETDARPADEKAATTILESRATAIPISPQMLLTISPIIATFALVLIIACANVANMMLARGLARQREIGIRLTLGAGRRRLVRQLLTESVFLALPAAALSVVVARLAVSGAVGGMVATMPAEFVEFIRVAPLPSDGRVLAFTAIAALVTAIVFGLAPALQTTRANVVSMARGDFGSDFGPARLRKMLVVVQIAASVLLLVTSAVLVRSAQRLARVDPGVRTRGVVALDIREPFRARVLEGLAASPVVATIAAASPTPLNGNASSVGVGLGGRTDVVPARYRFASPGYFDVFDVRIVSGRNFTPTEARAGAAVAIVSESAAREWWPDGDALGQRLRLVPDPRLAESRTRIRRFPAVEVIGVARDTAVDLAQSGPVGSALLLPIDPSDAFAELNVRVIGETEAARRSLDRSLSTTAPGAIQEIHKLEEFAAGRLYPFRAVSFVSGAVGVLALLLTISGVYGVLSYLVTQRAKEIAIRVALGAHVWSVAGLVLRQSLRLAMLGAGIGVLLALGLAQIFGWRIVLLRPFDPIAYVAGVIVVVVACTIASSIPARRAARLDPMTTLRAD